jgi:hypothetical protein
VIAHVRTTVHANVRANSVRSVLTAEWRLFPLGRQRGLRERVLRRLRVREDGTLSTVSSGNGPELALNE